MPVPVRHESSSWRVDPLVHVGRLARPFCVRRIDHWSRLLSQRSRLGGLCVPGLQDVNAPPICKASKASQAKQTEYGVHVAHRQGVG